MNASCNKANTHKRNGERYGGNASNSAFPVPKGILHMRVFLAVLAFSGSLRSIAGKGCASGIIACFIGFCLLFWVGGVYSVQWHNKRF